jgi:hypothetical protein
MPCAGQQPLHIQNDMHAGPGVQRLRPSVRQALRWPWLTSAPVGAEKMRSSGRRLQITANPAVLKTNPPATSVGQNLTLGPCCPPRPTCQFPALLDHHCPTPCSSAARVAQGPSVAPRCSGSDPGVRAHHRRDWGETAAACRRGRAYKPARRAAAPTTPPAHARLVSARIAALLPGHRRVPLGLGLKQAVAGVLASAPTPWCADLLWPPSASFFPFDLIARLDSGVESGRWGMGGFGSRCGAMRRDSIRGSGSGILGGSVAAFRGDWMGLCRGRGSSLIRACSYFSAAFRFVMWFLTRAGAV